jgi:hypothetical protein
LAPPATEDCLVQLRADKYKGGTRIAEDVWDLAEHERRLADPDGYRPESCARCLHRGLHVLCYPVRLLLADGRAPTVRIVQYICARDDCGATWRILPAFLARHLWRSWPTVERTVLAKDTPARCDAPKVPERTKRRWRSRLASTARVLVVLLGTSGSAELAAIGNSVGLDASRAQVVAVHARAAATAPGFRLAALAALVDRLERGIRLM